VKAKPEPKERAPQGAIRKLITCAGPASKVMDVKTGKATSGEEAYQEGWDSIGGPDDCPYPIDDSRSDYWDMGYKQRRDLDKKLRAKYGKGEVQQAGIVDKVTLPLPEVGGPQVQEIDV
jgi:hypothetical protein